MAKYECVVRIPPDVTGRTYYEGEVYDLGKDEIEALRKSGHFGATYADQTVEPHFLPLTGGAPEPIGQAAGGAEDDEDDGLAGLNKIQLLDLAGELGLAATTAMKKDEILALIRQAKAAGGAE
jgi:hypothetical protein